MAWVLTSDGRTVVRAGSGVYYAPTLMSAFVQSILFNGGNPELGYSVSTTNPAALAAAFQATGVNLSQAPLGNLPVFSADQVYRLLGTPSSRVGLTTNFIDPYFRNPRAFQWKVGIDREFAGIIAGIDYTSQTTESPGSATQPRTPVPDATGRLIYANPRPL